VSGCLAKVQVYVNKRKFGPKIIDYVCIGYTSNSTTYRFFVINSVVPEISNNTIRESWDATFF